MTILGDRIREQRKELGLSQEELAKLLNVGGKSTISQYETGTNNPDNDTLINLSNLFNCSTDYLLGKTNIKSMSISYKPSPLATEIENLNDESKKELEKYIQLLKIKEEIEKSKDETSSASVKNA